MFGLTFEKLLLVAIIAGAVIGPQRLPHYAQQLTETIRALRDVVQSARDRAEQELGFSHAEWDALDPRQYDPRRVLREALDDRPSPNTPTSDVSAAIQHEAARVRPGQKYLVTGSAAHPHRVRIDSLDPADPRRVAAQRPVPSAPSHPLAPRDGDRVEPGAATKGITTAS